MLKRVILTAASAIALTAAANAADVYVPGSASGYKDASYVAVNWGGLYAGVNGGGAWSGNSDQFALSGLGGVSPSGGFGGGQIGYNWQGVWHSHLVLGVEADIQGAGISATDAYGDKSELDYFGTVRGRAGYAFERVLVYATAGLAYGDVNNRAVGSFNNTNYLFQNSGTTVGYVVGGGVEYKLSPIWSVKAEYQYIDLGKNDPSNSVLGSFSSVGGTVNDDAYHTFRAGVNYFVGGGYEPLK